MSSSNNPNRRRLNASSETAPSMSFALEHTLADLLISADATSTISPGGVSGSELSTTDVDLQRMLSVHTEVSTTSSAAQRHAAAQSSNRDSFKKIGAGSCGAIFSKEGTSVIVKLAKSDSLELWNDYVMHTRIAKRFAMYEIDEVKIPDCYYFVPKNDPQYFAQHPGLIEAADTVCNLPTNALVTERILPLPQSTRSLLIDKYCASKNKQKAIDDPANKDCLVRMYLGSMHGKSGGMFFSLRNFKMHLNQMLEIQLDVNALAIRMAIAMAVMHWGAKTDGRDVEFALGSSTKKQSIAKDPDELEELPPNTYTGPPSRIHEDFFRRTTELWLLDFNQVRPITLDEAGVAQAVEAVRINDPYIPRPLQSSAIEKQVWNAFVINYLTASQIIIEGEGLGEEALRLPPMFLRGLIEMQQTKQAKTSVAQEP